MRQTIYRFTQLMTLSTLLALLAGCGSGMTPTIFKTPDYERYVDSLKGLELDRSTMGVAWLAASREALSRPQAMVLPFREEILFSPDRPAAVAWQLNLRKGQRLRAVLLAQPPALPVAQPSAPPTGSPFFLQLFRVHAEDQAPKFVTEPGEDGVLVHDVEDDGPYLLSLQPELLAGGQVTLQVTGGGQLTFPVDGRDENAIGSRFGDPRDGGRRLHEGVDIFAPRGSLALAAVDGVVTRVGTNRLGGNIVWMRGDGKSLYYAHLDEHLVGPGRVTAGEPIGRVGNTGNARTTPPHLHFGLFQGGPVDPAPYLASPGTPPGVTADRKMLGRPARVASRLARLRSGPSTSHEIRDELEQSTALHVEAANRDWYRIRLDDGRHGYMAGSLVTATDPPLRRIAAEGDAFLLHRPSETAPRTARIALGDKLQVLAELGSYLLVATEGDVVGWLAPEPPATSSPGSPPS